MHLCIPKWRNGWIRSLQVGGLPRPPVPVVTLPIAEAQNDNFTFVGNITQKEHGFIVENAEKLSESKK